MKLKSIPSLMSQTTTRFFAKRFEKNGGKRKDTHKDKSKVSRLCVG
jgi:hypothetical protein